MPLRSSGVWCAPLQKKLPSGGLTALVRASHSKALSYLSIYMLATSHLVLGHAIKLVGITSRVAAPAPDLHLRSVPRAASKAPWCRACQIPSSRGASAVQQTFPAAVSDSCPGCALGLVISSCALGLVISSCALGLVISSSALGFVISS